MIKLADLEKLNYFEGLKDEDLASIAARMNEKHIGKGEIVAFEGAGCQGLYIVGEGQVKIFKTSEEGREYIYYNATAGDAFCDLSIFDGRPNPISATATVESIVYILPAQDLQNLLKKIPDLAMLLLKKFTDKMRYLVGVIEDLSFKNVPERIAKIIVDMVNKEGASQGNKAILKRSITLYEMASMVGTVREVVTRSLQAMEKEGILKVSRQQIEILDLNKLKKMAGAG